MKGPFGQSTSLDPNLSVHGSMSFAPNMHGTFPAQSSFFHDTTLVDLSDESAKKIATLQAKLNKRLGPEYISQRPGPGGGPKLTYAEGADLCRPYANLRLTECCQGGRSSTSPMKCKSILLHLAFNLTLLQRFGFNGWSSQVISMHTDFIDCNEQSQRFSVGITAIVRVTLRDGVYHEDVGYGLLENSKSKGAALDKVRPRFEWQPVVIDPNLWCKQCKKEAVTDAVKRTLRNFGNLLGNCLYDKSYTQEVVKMKAPPVRFPTGIYDMFSD